MIEEIVVLKQSITNLLKDNYSLREQMLAQQKVSDDAFQALLCDYILAYDEAPQVSKTTILKNLQKYGVSKIPLATVNQDNEMVVIKGYVAQSNQRNGTILSFEKDGFTWSNKVIRRAEVIVVKN